MHRRDNFMKLELTWIHNSFRPLILDIQPIDLPPLILMYGTVAVVIRIMLWLNIAIVDTISHLQILQKVEHFLLVRKNS